MNYIKEAEQYLYHYRDMYVSIENMHKEISKLVWSGPKDISAVQLDVTGVHGSNQQDETINIMYKIQTLTNSKEQTKNKLDEMDNILEEIANEKGCELYGHVLRKWYIERIPKEDIAKEIGYSSKQSIYSLRAKAIRKFAIRLFGIEALKAI